MNSSSLPNIFVVPPLWLALLLVTALVLVSVKMRWLTLSGAISTFVVGMVIFWKGGGYFTIPLLTFFISSSLLSKLRGAKNSGGRNAAQVWANGAVAAVIVLMFWHYVHLWPMFLSRILLMLYLSALSAVNSDTWATEIGRLSKSSPRLLSNWKTVPPGTSGAVTGLGLVGGVLGAIVIPLSALPFWHLDLLEFVVVAWAGVLGSLADSLLGATFQEKFQLANSDLTTEERIPGARQRLTAGLPYFNNDVVNFFASLVGVLSAWVMLRFSAFP